MNNTDFFRVEDVSAGYGKKEILHKISFTVDNKSITGILGGNGCGKTTLLKAVCGMIPHGGGCYLKGSRLENMRGRQVAGLISYIPQRSGITISMSVLNVVLMGFNPRVGILSQPSETMRKQAVEAIEKVGLLEYLNTDYLLLSEGQKQLCIIARTMIENSNLLLLDEPESALDFGHRHHIMKIISEMVKSEEKEGCAALVCLHDPNLALEMCDKILLFDNKECYNVISPKKDDIGTLQRELSKVYGNITVAETADGRGRCHRVLLWNEEI